VNSMTKNEKIAKLDALSSDRLSKIKDLIPLGFSLVSRQLGEMDKERVEIIRYERTDGKNRGLGGEHFSAVVSQTGILKGITTMDESSQKADGLPSKKESEIIMQKFLSEYAPDLQSNMTIKWIDKHDETIEIIDDNGKVKKIKVIGMKVKCRKKDDGLYFWAIINHQNKVITFERDIEWSFFRSKRITEKWLHDSWLIGQS